MGDSKGYPVGYKVYQGVLTAGAPTKTCVFTTDISRSVMFGFIATDDDGAGGGAQIAVKVDAGETINLQVGEVLDISAFAPVGTVLLTRVAADGYYRVVGR